MTMKVFVVSLDSATDRRKSFSQQASDTSLEWRFFDAHRGLGPALNYDESAARLHKGRALHPGELGCYSSHYAIWQQLLESQDEACIVLEDDVVPDWRFLEALSEQPLLDQGIRYLRLYYKYPARFIIRRRDFVRRSTSVLEMLDFCFGTQGYVITRPAAAVFVEKFRNVVRPIDDQMDRHWDHGIPNLSIFPFPIFETMLESNIGTERFAGEGRRTAARKSAMWADRIRKRIAIAQRRRVKSLTG